MSLQKFTFQGQGNYGQRIPTEEVPVNDLPENNQNRRFFFDFSSFGFDKDKDEKERCQFKPYYYDTFADGLSG